MTENASVVATFVQEAYERAAYNEKRDFVRDL